VREGWGRVSGQFSACRALWRHGDGVGSSRTASLGHLEGTDGGDICFLVRLAGFCGIVGV
jgi:hypothetical protein